MNILTRLLSTTRRRILLITALLGLISTGCYGVRSRLIDTPTPPEELFRCVQLELGRAGYAIVGADRESGWVQGQKRVTDFLRRSRRAEIYATVIPEESGTGSHLQLTDNSYADEDAEQIQSACASDGDATPDQ